jgi:RNA polymerase sigma factor (TIGR02999 family)
MNDVTQILAAIDQGDPHAADQLLPLVYDELRRLAGSSLAKENPGQTLQATALVHEAYLRLVGVKQARQWDNRRHFFAAAAEAIRRILVENARRKRAKKAGGAMSRTNLDEAAAIVDPEPDDLLALDEALAKLSREDSAATEIAKLRLFAGQTVDEAAQILGISRTTGFRHWTYARAFLQAELQSDTSIRE